jgi:hypothetical protein
VAGLPIDPYLLLCAMRKIILLGGSFKGIIKLIPSSAQMRKITSGTNATK